MLWEFVACVYRDGICRSSSHCTPFVFPVACLCRIKCLMLDFRAFPLDKSACFVVLSTCPNHPPPHPSPMQGFQFSLVLLLSPLPSAYTVWTSLICFHLPSHFLVFVDPHPFCSFSFMGFWEFLCSVHPCLISSYSLRSSVPHIVVVKWNNISTCLDLWSRQYRGLNEDNNLQLVCLI